MPESRESRLGLAKLQSHDLPPCGHSLPTDSKSAAGNPRNCPECAGYGTRLLTQGPAPSIILRHRTTPEVFPVTARFFLQTVPRGQLGFPRFLCRRPHPAHLGICSMGLGPLNSLIFPLVGLCISSKVSGCADAAWCLTNPRPSGDNRRVASPQHVGLWRSWERASMAWKRSSVRSRSGPPNLFKHLANPHSPRLAANWQQISKPSSQRAPKLLFLPSL
jgi:hypothetical protein